MKRTLVIGFGNVDRADDGVAFHIVNAFRQRMGQGPLAEDNTGLEELGAPVDSVFIGQLVPEMIDLLDDYNRVVFVDAQVDPALDDLYCAAVSPDEAGLTFTHHMSPATLLAFFKALHGRDLEGHLVSIRGRDFDFHRNLSENTLALVDLAVERILELTSAS
jgi:hydrogenase maturation protease